MLHCADTANNNPGVDIAAMLRMMDGGMMDGGMRGGGMGGQNDIGTRPVISADDSTLYVATYRSGVGAVQNLRKLSVPGQAIDSSVTSTQVPELVLPSAITLLPGKKLLISSNGANKTEYL